MRSDDSSERGEHDLNQVVSDSGSADSGARSAPSRSDAARRADAGAVGPGASNSAPRGAAAGDSGGTGSSAAASSGGPSASASGGGDSPAQGAAMSGMPSTSGGAAGAPAACEPRAEECNGSDEDCDGQTDEFTDAECYPDGQAGCTRDAAGRWTCSGTCATGKRVCSDGKLQGCAQYISPSPESCTDVGIQAADEDCNGKTDETCACVSGDVSSCYDGRAGTRDVGKCKAGTQTCTDGQLGPCTGQVAPGVEDCSNMNSDDDCDGQPDNVRGLGDNCAVPGAAGSCSRGKLQCQGGTELRCVGEAPQTESCNGIDDDCNGEVDNGFNLTRDQNNCGECDNKCSGAEECRQGKCTAPMMDEDPKDPPPNEPKGCQPACGAGQACCGGSCIDTQSDANNCGACGNACSGAAQPGCCGGRCVDLVSNQNCGRCGRDCSLLGNGGITCSCGTSGNGGIECTGPVLNLCL